MRCGSIPHPSAPKPTFEHILPSTGCDSNGIVNGSRHLREVQRNLSTILPQKMPTHYHITLHVDDESVICTQGRQYGYYAYQLNAQDDDWAEKIIERAESIKKAQRDRFL